MKRLAWALVLGSALAACGDDTGGSGASGSGGGDGTTAASGSTTGDATSGASTSGATGTGGGAVDDIFLCEETDFEDDFPLGGPGFDPENGIIGEPQETYLVATTHLFL